MGLFKKIFKGKKKDKEVEAGAIGSPSFPSATASESRSGQNGKKGSPSASISTNGSNAMRNSNPSGSGSGSGSYYKYNPNSPNHRGNARGSSGPVDTDDDGIIIPRETENVEEYYARARNQTQEELRIAYELSQAQRNQIPTPSISSDERLTNPSSSGDYDDSLTQSPPRLTSNQLQQWDRKSNEQRPSSPIVGGISPSSLQQQLQQPAPPLNTQPQRIYSMSSALPSHSSALPSQQRKFSADDTVQSESDASSFNLSTDAEDSEYEYMKRTTMRFPLGNLEAGLTALDTSAIDTVGSITSYTTDQDSKIFANLPTDDEMTLGTEASSKTGQPVLPSLLLQPLPNPLQANHAPVPDPDDTMDSNQAAMASSGATNNASLNISNDSSISKNVLQNIRQNSLGPSWTDFAADPTKQPTSTKSISRNKPGGTPRNFTSPKATASTNTDYSNDGFGRIRKGSAAAKPFESKIDTQRKSPTAATTTTTTPSEIDDSGFSGFGDFADFSGFPSTANVNQGAEWETVKEEKKDSPSWENHDEAFFGKNSKSPSAFGNSSLDDPAWNVDLSSPTEKKHNRDDPFDVGAGVGAGNYLSGGFSSGPSSPHDTSLTELLEAAKSKRKGRRSLGSTRHGIRSSSTVNSAPSITSSYLRQHHNLGSNSHHNDTRGRVNASQPTSYGSNVYSPERASATGDGTSVSDIISSLEATDRMKRVEKITSHRSMGDADVVATARAAKERLRERRRREREAAAGGGRNPSIRHSNSRDQGSDSDESDGQKESWLFDQVTGAIGPAGIAADLESLSGRSNRSKNSHGKKSLSSNRRRSNRHKAGSRRHRGDASVDSRGSRTSRYSHRSTKSFLSQMSEQSRSVANDLLRLEMQLAMVGNNNNATATDADGLPVASSSARMSSGASLGGGSRASARSSGRKSTGGISARHAVSPSSSSVVRRQRITVVAPPGKLGIILANKSDSKGTVVSGVRTSSVLVDRISPGDRIVAIDGEDVSRMTVSEITTIMSRKAEYERRLTVMTGTVSASVVRTSSDLRSPSRGSRSSPRAMSVGGGGAGDYGGGDRGFSTTGSLSSYRR